MIIRLRNLLIGVVAISAFSIVVHIRDIHQQTMPLLRFDGLAKAVAAQPPASTTNTSQKDSSSSQQQPVGNVNKDENEKGQSGKDEKTNTSGSEKNIDTTKPVDEKPSPTPAEQSQPKSVDAVQQKNSDNVSFSKNSIVKALAERQAKSDERARSLDARESLIKVAEQRVDQKISELKNIRAQIEELLGKVDEAQKAKIESLVKVYEIMKPKEAARIFATLDMPILISVVKKMKPAKTAAILAEMPPEKAKELTMELSKKDPVPIIDETDAPAR